MHNPEDRSFLGHPRGLGYIAFTEAWERFSYYGMQALLVLFMVNYVLHPGHIEHIAGFGPLRHLLERMRGPLDVQPLASTIFGLYTGLVYLTPIIGGLIADRWLGRTLTITIGACLMAVGQFLVGLDVSFLLGLVCLLVGVGCFKGNLASQVGSLYATGDNRRADAFQIYYIFINAGVIAAPLIAGTLGEKVGWAWGFDAAGVGMLIGLAIYLLGRKYLPPDSPVVEEKAAHAAKPKLMRQEKMAIVILLVLLPVLTISIIPNQQIFNAYLVWAQDHADLTFFGKKMPTTWLITLDSIISVSFLFIAVVFWRLWAKKFREPAEIMKIAIGSLIAVAGMLSLFIGSTIAAQTGKNVSIGWLIAFHVLNSAGFANVFPVSLALYARVAPAALSATIIGIYYLAFFAANNLVGWIGGFLETMPAPRFWLLHAALAGVAGIIFLLAGKIFGHLLAPTDEKPAAT
ncbi:MAG TPA: peptide MFS transporter [Chthoniobacterales bacterium]|jgi:amino acid/peptide transporter (Peptide:H+ symporter), bacterial|nr:peptide MFS transporter [Chthoniobacterales bacterium]